MCEQTLELFTLVNLNGKFVSVPFSLNTPFSYMVTPEGALSYRNNTIGMYQTEDTDPIFSGMFWINGSDEKTFFSVKDAMNFIDNSLEV